MEDEVPQEKTPTSTSAAAENGATKTKQDIGKYEAEVGVSSSPFDNYV